jgi:molybdate transport system ATP-binding protein
VPTEEPFANINFELKKGEHWIFLGNNEPLKMALIEALAGNAAVIGGGADYPFLEKYRVAIGSEPFLSPHRFIVKIAERHSFHKLSNTSQLYYQQRFNSSDAESSLTVQEYLEGIHTTSEWIEQEVMITRLKLKPLLSKHLIKLSNGETKRLLIAAALLRHPEVLLLVNPFAGLDTGTRREIRQLINEMAESGVTIVLSTPISEIPEAITHIARFDGNHTISIFKKESAQIVNSEPENERRVSEAEIASLLALGNRPAFNEIVQMKNVQIQYGEKRVLDTINWTIKQGERWALLGSNGAGKSTLLSVVNGDNPQAFANHIILFDRKKGSGESIWEIKRNIGFFSPELYQYFPLETGCLDAVESGFYDTIGLFRPKNEELRSIALRWMALLGVAHLSRKTLHQVSADNQRLCLLARAFVKSPPLLILDEPCQGFNDGQVALFKNLVNMICRASNTTMIYVTHYNEEIPECVRNIFTLEGGRKVE